jgi:hypothetical protein
LGNVPATESKTAVVRIFNFGAKGLEAASRAFVNEETADHYEVSVSELSTDEVKQERDAVEGLRVEVTVKPGLPLGPLRQSLTLRLNRADEETLELPINGQIVSDISLIGPRNVFISEHNLVNFGLIRQKEGAEAKLILLVKGPHRDGVEFSIAEVSPDDVVQAALGERDTTASGSLVKQPLVIQIPRGARAVSKMGLKREDLGKITLKTTHPDVPQIDIYVKFVVAP